MFPLSPLIISLIIPLVISQSTCYWPNGMVAQGYASCSGTDAAAMCYFTPHADTCEPNGLVLGTNNVYYRNTCTDPTWKSPACLLLCPWVQITYVDLLHCADGSFCCGSANTTCCALRQGYFISSTTASIISSAVQSSTPTLTQSTPKPSTASPTTKTNTLSVPGTTSPAGTSPSSSQSSISNTLAIGLGVALGVALLLALSCVAFLYLRVRRHMRNESLVGQMPRNTTLNGGVIGTREKGALDFNTQRPNGSGMLVFHELGTCNPISELS